MTNNDDGRAADSQRHMSGRKSDWLQRGVLGAVCVLVVGVYASGSRSGTLELSATKASDTYYNLLVQGFRDGQLSLKTEVPTGLLHLADPYDPTANTLYQDPPYQLHDLSYYKGRVYLYFGPTPALILFWPFVALTGHYLFHREAVPIFCAIGFLASVGLLCALWRRYFSRVNVWVVAACALALGLATGVPALLARAEVYEVAIACGYMLTMLALGAIWCALHNPERRCQWLAAASLAYGLAVGARASLLFGGIFLLLPVVQAWRERRRIGAPLTAATVPIVLIGLGLMLYNARRFDNPFEFGMRYQLGGERQDVMQFFSPRYFWFNLQAFFLRPAQWSGRFPFVHDIAMPPVPSGHQRPESPFGVLTNIPLVWLALAIPAAWCGRSREELRGLRVFLATVAVLFGICTMTLLLFRAANFRYEVEFLPALLLLSVAGVLGLECALVDQPVLRRAARLGWGLLLGFSIAFNLLAVVKPYADTHNNLGIVLQQRGKIEDAIAQYEHALRISPNYAEAHNNLAAALLQAGRPQEAIEHLVQALRIKPDYAEAHNNIGNALFAAGRIEDAIAQYQQALSIKPDYTEAHNNLGVALFLLGKAEEASTHFEQALRSQPDFADVQRNLAWLLATLPPAEGGDPIRAVALAERACALTGNQVPPYLDTLAAAYAAAGRFDDAIATAQKAIELARAAGQLQTASEIEAHLQLYRSGRPLRQAGNKREPHER